MSWQDYKGIAGYNKMIDEIRASIYREFPETKGRLYIYNQLAPGEVERAKVYLQVPDLVKQVNHSISEHYKGTGIDMKFPSAHGFMQPLTDKYGKTVYLALGINPRWVPRQQGGEKRLVPNGTDAEVEKSLTPETILWAAWHNLHEAGHGVQHVTQSLINDPVAKFAGRYQESHAEVFARALLVHNGAPRDKLLNVVAGYDARRFGSLLDRQEDRYDPSAALFSLISGEPKRSELLSYDLKDVAQIYQKSQQATRAIFGDRKQQEGLEIQERALTYAMEELKRSGKTYEQIKGG